jgi:hypothetical protein
MERERMLDKICVEFGKNIINKLDGVKKDMSSLIEDKQKNGKRSGKNGKRKS